MRGLYSKTTKILFWKVKETKWIIATAAVIIVMVSMVFSVSQSISGSYQQAMMNLMVPFDISAKCETDEEVKQLLSLSVQEDADILSMVTTGHFWFQISQNIFHLDILAASDSLEEMYNINIIEGEFPQNSDEIMLDSKINEVSKQNYQVGDSIIVEGYMQDSGKPKTLELKIVGFFEVSHGTGFELYGYMSEEAGKQISSLLNMEETRNVYLKLSNSSYDKVYDLWERLKPDFEGKLAFNTAKFNILYEEEGSAVVNRVFEWLGIIVVVISALLFNGIFRLNILNIQKRIGLLRCMGFNRKQLVLSMGISVWCFVCGYIILSLPIYLLCANLFGPQFFQNALQGFNISEQVSLNWSFSMKPYAYSLLGVTLVMILVYVKLIYNVLTENPLALIRGIEKVRISRQKWKKEKSAIALIGKRNLLRSKSRTFILRIVFFLMSSLLLVSVITSVTIAFTEIDVLKRGKAYDYEFYTDYHEDDWIDEECLEAVENLADVEYMAKACIRFIDFFETEQVVDVNEERVGIMVYSDELLAMTCKECGITYEIGQEMPQYYAYTFREEEYETMSIWDAEGNKKEVPISGKIHDAVYSYIKAGEDGIWIITNEAGARELYGEVKYNVFYVKWKENTNVLDEIKQVMERNSSMVYSNDLKEANNEALEQLDAMLFMVAYIAVCIGFMVIVNIICNVTINIITRQQELGILAAMGMAKQKIIQLIIYEITAVLGDSILWSLPLSLMLSVSFQMGVGQECDYVKLILVAVLCVFTMYMLCYLICYWVGSYLLKRNVTRVLSEE